MPPRERVPRIDLSGWASRQALDRTYNCSSDTPAPQAPVSFRSPPPVTSAPTLQIPHLLSPSSRGSASLGVCPRAGPVTASGSTTQSCHQDCCLLSAPPGADPCPPEHAFHISAPNRPAPPPRGDPTGQASCPPPPPWGAGHQPSWAKCLFQYFPHFTNLVSHVSMIKF